MRDRLRLFQGGVRRRWREVSSPYLHGVDKAVSYVSAYVHLAAIWLVYSSSNRPLVVISLTEHMGDIIAAEPLSRYVKERHKNSILVWVTKRPYVEVVRSFAAVDYLVSVGCISVWARLRNMKILKYTYDLHVNLRECSVCRKPVVRVGGNPDINPVNYYNYGSLLGVMCLNAGLPVISGNTNLQIPASVREKVDSLGLPVKYIVIHAASNERSRDWRPEKWHDLVDLLLDKTDCSVVEIGLRKVIETSSERYVDLCGKCSVIDTAEVLRRSILFIGVDSGPAHLANAVMAQSVIILGKYREFDRYLPYSGYFVDGQGATIISEGYPAEQVSTNTVFQAVLSRLSDAGPRQ